MSVVKLCLSELAAAFLLVLTSNTTFSVGYTPVDPLFLVKYACELAIDSSNRRYTPVTHFLMAIYACTRLFDVISSP